MLMMRLMSVTVAIKNRKAQEAEAKEQLKPIVWHPLRWLDRGMSEVEKITES